LSVCSSNRLTFQEKILDVYSDKAILKADIMPAIHPWIKHLTRNPEITEKNIDLNFFRTPLFQDLNIPQPAPRPIANRAEVVIASKRRLDEKADHREGKGKACTKSSFLTLI
jgi:hypothetical protein